MSNIDELKNIMDKISGFENDLTLFFKHIPVIFCIADRVGSFKTVNPEFTKILGWTDEELAEKPWSSFVHPEVLKVTIVVTTLSDTNPLVGFTNRVRAKNGEYITLRWYTSNWVDDKNYCIAIPEK